MTFRYRGFLIHASNPTEAPVHLAVYDPLRPAEALWTFTHPHSVDRAVRAMRRHLDGLCDAEVSLVAGELEIRP